MKIVPNWSRLSGRIQSWDPPARSDEPGTLGIRVEQVEEVAGESRSSYANLLAGSEGRVLRVQVPASAAASLRVAVGARIEVDVRRGRSPEQLFANPDRISIGHSR